MHMQGRKLPAPRVALAYLLLLAAARVSGGLSPEALQSLCAALQQLVVEQHQHLAHLQGMAILGAQGAPKCF